MEPKEKAIELLDKMSEPIEGHKNIYYRQCALIAVDEIINLLRGTKFLTPDLTISYWVKVKKEIEKL